MDDFLHRARKIWIGLCERNKIYSVVVARSNPAEASLASREGEDVRQPQHGDTIIRAAKELLANEFGERHQDLDEGISLVLIDNGNNQVVGHVKLTIEESTQITRAKALRMLERGVPRRAVELAVQTEGNFSSLDQLLAEEGTNFSSTDNNNNTPTSCYIDALVVRPEYRGRGLGRVLAMAAVAVASVHLGATHVTAFAATTDLAGWYERLGAQRDVNAVVGKTAKDKQRRITLDLVEDHNFNGKDHSSLEEALRSLGVDNDKFRVIMN